MNTLTHTQWFRITNSIFIPPAIRCGMLNELYSWALLYFFRVRIWHRRAGLLLFFSIFLCMCLSRHVFDILLVPCRLFACLFDSLFMFITLRMLKAFTFTFISIRSDYHLTFNHYCQCTKLEISLKPNKLQNVMLVIYLVFFN